MTELTLSKLVKALYSAAVAGLGALGSSLSGAATFASLSDGQVTWIILAALVAGGGTYGLAGWSGPHLNGGNQPPKR
jgi:hypothetical protein